jgi:DeoR family fructose operon transcriptional repressor
MLKVERQEKIISALTHNKAVEVIKLSETFKVSEITIRRDLDELTLTGKIQRFRGGASLTEPIVVEPPVVQRQQEQVVEKEAIARLAIEYVKNGNTIALEAGSTTLALANQIAARQWDNLQIITNSVLVLKVILPLSGISTLFVGGLVDPNEWCTFGDLAEEVLKRIHIDTYFCGCRGLHPSFGRSNEMQTGVEVGTVHAFASASDFIVILADHTKFSKVFSLQLLPINQVNMVITSELTPEKIVEEIRQKGVAVETAMVQEFKLCG